jgi:hypothetical protein
MVKAKLMKMNISFFKLATLTTCSLLVAIVSHATNIYEYDWVGGKPGFSGKIFLDAPSSASAPNGGTVADVLAGSYLTTPLGDYPIFDSTFSYLTAPSVIWDQTHIIAMVLFFKPTTPIYDPVYWLPTEAVAQVAYFGVNNGLETTIVQSGGGWYVPFADSDYTGQWLAVTVPEPATFMLAALGVAALIVFRPRAKVGRKMPNETVERTGASPS